VVEACAERGLLAEIARKGEGADARVALVGGDDGGERRVGAAVVDEEDFPAALGGDAVENGADAIDEGEDAVHLILHRNNDREERRYHAALHQLGMQVAHRRRRDEHGFLTLSSHLFLPCDGRLDRNGLRDLYFFGRDRRSNVGD
jgi:hypothetical protein